MKMMKSLLLLGGLWVGSLSLLAQSDEYLDDAYLSRKDVEQRQAKAKAKAEAERKAREEAQRLWEEQYAKERAEFLKKQRSREIDAYNGILSAEDSLRITEDAKLHARERMRQSEGSPQYYGEYSRRLNRFYGDGSTVVVNNYYNDVYDVYPYSRGYYSWGVGSSFYPWYDSYYSVYRHSPWSNFYGWDYPYWGRSRFYSYYDPFYDPWYDPWYRGSYYGGYYGGYYGAFYAGFYSPYYGYYGYYPYGYSSSAYYSANRYRGAARSAYSDTTRGYGSYRSSYGAFESARAAVEAGRTPNYGNAYRSPAGSSAVGGSYSGVGRSAYGQGADYNYNARRDTYRSTSRDNQSYNSGSSVGNSGSGRSYGGATSSGGGGRSRR